MRPTVFSGPRRAAFWPLLLSAAAFACSAPGPGSDAPGTNLGGAGGQAGSGFAGTSSASSGAGGLAPAVGGTAPVASGGVSNGGSAAGHAGSGGVAIAGTGGALVAGSHSGGASGAASAGNAGSGSGGGAGNNAVCQMVKSEYAAELEKQLGCNPNAGSQCTNKVAAAPGCECRVFMQPTDPFAIEHLSNLGNGWFEADCSMPSCPAKCSTAAAGTCQADAKSPLGGRCVTP